MDSIQYFNAPAVGTVRRTGDVLQGYAYIEPSDVAYAKVTPCFENGKGLVGCDLEREVFATSELTVLRPKFGVDQQFLAYVLQSEAFRSPAVASMTGAGGLKRVDETEMRSLKVWCPSSPEQRAIADYLDHETAEIDAFITDLQHMMSLAREDWSARRDEALSRGVSGEAITTSTHTWFSHRAVSWREGPLKLNFSITLGKMLDESRHSAESEYYPYIRAADIGDGRLNLTGLNRMPFARSERRKYQLTTGDILVVEGGSIGTNVVLDESLPETYFQKTVNRMRVTQDADPYFYSEVLNAYRESEVLATICNGSTIMHLTAEKLGNLVVPVPPAKEQQSIGRHLQAIRAQIESLEDQCRQAIALAQERRAALISAAVTGHIDVTQKQRPVAEQLEDEVTQLR